jgi:hypothetical protein
MSSFRTLPSEDPGVSRMEFDYYHKGSDAEFKGKTSLFFHSLLLFASSPFAFLDL